MIWDTSIWRLGCSNHSKILSAQKCYPCLRYVVSPMSPGRTQGLWSGRWNRTNPNEPNKGVTTRFSVQSESSGVRSRTNVNFGHHRGVSAWDREAKGVCGGCRDY